MTATCPRCGGTDIVEVIVETSYVTRGVCLTDAGVYDGGEVDREVMETEPRDDGYLCRDCGEDGLDEDDIRPVDPTRLSERELEDALIDASYGTELREALAQEWRDRELPADEDGEPIF